MYLLPAIDILDGKVVRLAGGDFHEATVYNADPSFQAQLFEEDGAKWVHVVDLDGAKAGNPENIDVVKRILQKTTLKVEVGGGIRNMDAVRRYADAGVARVVLGTALVKDPEFAAAAREEFGPQMLACGVDARAGVVQVEGWLEGGDVKALELAKRLAEEGFEHLVYTDIARDGMQTGVDPAMYKEMAAAFDNPVIASGGVARIADLQALKGIEDCIEGVIVGRAIYEGNFSVADGVAVCEGTMEFAC